MLLKNYKNLKKTRIIIPSSFFEVVMLLNLHEYIKKVKNGEKIKKKNIVLEFEENEIYEYLNDVNIRNIIQDTLDNICLIEIEMKTIKDYKIRNV